MNLNDFLRSCLEDTINNGDTSVPQADALLPGKHASATHRQEAGVEASSPCVPAPASPHKTYVAVGSVCLVFEGDTLEEAKRKARHWVGDRCYCESCLGLYGVRGGSMEAFARGDS